MFESSSDIFAPSKSKTIELLVKKLGEFLKTLNAYAIHHEIVNQMFKQVVNNIKN